MGPVSRVSPVGPVSPVSRRGVLNNVKKKPAGLVKRYIPSQQHNYHASNWNLYHPHHPHHHQGSQQPQHHPNPNCPHQGSQQSWICASSFDVSWHQPQQQHWQCPGLMTVHGDYCRVVFEKKSQLPPRLSKKNYGELVMCCLDDIFQRPNIGLHLQIS